MKVHRIVLWALLYLVVMLPPGFSQKVKVGYDKSADFSKYKTYSWTKPQTSPTRPVLYATVVSEIDGALASKGFKRVEENGELILMTAGGIDYATAFSGGTPIPSIYSGPPPAINSNMWTGAEGGGQMMAIVSDATLVVEFADRATNTVVWSGTVKQKLDIERKNKSLELASKAVTKLFKQFPPKSSR